MARARKKAPGALECSRGFFVSLRLLLRSTAERNAAQFSLLPRRRGRRAPARSRAGAYLSTCHLPRRTIGLINGYTAVTSSREARLPASHPHYSTRPGPMQGALRNEGEAAGAGAPLSA